MGDSWDETSFEVSEADPNSLVKHVDSDDMDKELFGDLGKASSSKPSLLQAMKKSTGKSMFDDEDSKNASSSKPQSYSKPEIKKQLQSTPKSVSKPNANNDDDLLADLLGDSDYSEISQQKPGPQKPSITRTPQNSTPPPTKSTLQKSTPTPTIAKKGNLFDNGDDDELLGMLDSDPIPQKAGSKLNTPKPSTPSNDIGKKSSRFDDLLSRTSLMKDTGEEYKQSRNISTPIRQGPKTDIEVDNSIGFTPSFFSSGGRSRRGLSSGVKTPKSSSLRPDDTFTMLMNEDRDMQADTTDIFRVQQDKPSTPVKSSGIEDMFRVDRQSTPKAQPTLRDEAGGSRSLTPTNQDTANRPHTHGGTTGENDMFTQSRPPSAGRRANTATPHRNSPHPESVHTPQRRKSEDSLFADEDIPNKALPWQGQTVHSAPQSSLPWDKPATPASQTPVSQTPANQTPPSQTPLPWENNSPGTPQGASGTATQMILQQNSVLEKKLGDLEAEKSRLQQELDVNTGSHAQTLRELNKEVAELQTKVDTQDRRLSEQGRELERSQSRLKDAASDLETIEQRTERKYKDEICLLEKSHQGRVGSLNVMLEEKEKIIQNEMKSASQRLKEKEAMLLEENKSLMQQWARRVEETEERYKRLMEEMTSSHSSAVATLKQAHEIELEEQQRLRKDELCAVLSVQQTTTALKELTDRVHLSAEEVASLTAKLDMKRTVSLEEREKAARVMSEYLHDLKKSLDQQQGEITAERGRIQEIVGRMESHLREQTRISNAAHNKLIADEARFQSVKAAWESERAEEERKLDVAREQLDRSKIALITEHKDTMEKFYNERKEIAKERNRVVNASHKATQQHAKGAVKQLDIEAQAQAMLDQAKREVIQIKTEKERWDKDHKTRQIFVESLQKEKDDLKTEKIRLSKLAEKLASRSKEAEGYSEALTTARLECVAVQNQLAKLETDLRMREEEAKIKEKTLRDTASSLAAEKDLLKLDRHNLNTEGIQCPACQKYRPRSRNLSNNHSPIRSSSPIRQHTGHVSIRSPTRSLSPLSPLNVSLLSTGSLVGSRYKYPSPSVLELTGSLQRFNAISDVDKHALQLQTDKLSKFREMDKKILSSSYS